MGKQESGGYSYFGFKDSPGLNFWIARKNETTGDWDYYYGTGGNSAFAAAWADPAALSFNSPPDT